MDALKILEEKLVRLSHRARELMAENAARETTYQIGS